MGLAGTLINTFVVVAVGAILAYLTNDKSMGLRREFDGLRREFDGLRTEFDGLRTEFDGLRTEFDGLRTDVKSEVGEVKSSIARLEDRLDAGLAGMHSEIVQVALAVGAKGQSARS